MKVFAYDHLLPGATMEKIRPLLQEEARHAWELYKKDVIRENYMRLDHPGAVIVLECASVEEAREVIAGFPLVKAGLIAFDLIPVGAFTPYEVAFGKEG